MERTQGKRLNRYVRDYVVFDLETTGISPARDAIIEISAIKVRNGDVTEEFSTLVNPERHIPAGATRVNGITDRMVAGAPGLEAALTDFLSFISEDILIGHNIHTFDLKFVYDSAWRLMEREIGNDYIDTLYLSRSVLPELKHHKLTDISAHFGINTAGAHRALADCVMNQQCYERLGGLLLRRGAGDCLQQEQKAAASQQNQREVTSQQEQKAAASQQEQKAAASQRQIAVTSQQEQKAVACLKGAEVCPQCGGELKLRNGKFGEFFGCGNYPRCRFTRNKILV